MEQSDSIKSVEAYRAAFAPVQRAQQEGWDALKRLARFQYEVAGDFLEHNLAGVQAMVSAATPTEYLAKQDRLNARFVAKVATHTREFLQEAAGRGIPDASAASAFPSSADPSPVRDDEIIGAEQEEKKAAQIAAHEEFAEHDAPVKPVAAKSRAATPAKKRTGKSRRG
jgi:hypothetical protein